MKIICIGRNYSAHAKELKSEIPSEPVIFLKPDTALLKGKNTFYLPSFSSNIHHELEIVLKICKEGKNIQKKFAHKYFEEISVGIDFTARDLQDKLKAKGLPWELSKAFDHSCPVGEFVSKNTLPESISCHMLLNGNKVQEGNSSNMLFDFDTIISFVSNYISLRKGDLIFTGTPEGVGKVNAGDKLEAFLEGKKLLELKIA